MSPEELLIKIRGIFALWRGRRYEQLAALCGSVLIAILVYASNEKEIPIIGHRAVIVPAVLAGTFLCVAFIVWRMGKLALASPDVVPERILSNAVRGPLPFVETDGELFLQLGRARDLQNILSYVTNKEIPLVVVSGESGAGKTSLLRAGLTHVLKSQYDRKCLYWDARPKDPERSLLHLLQAALGGPEKLPTLESLYQSEIPDTGLVVIMDQFEQLSLDNAEHRGIFEFISVACQRHPPHPVTWIIAFQREYGADWFEFQSNRGLNPAHVPIKFFSEEQAEKVMVTLGAAAGITFERLLLQDFIRSASDLGKVSPVDIGIGVFVLVSLAERTNKETLRFGDYNFAGGSIGVLTAYLQDRIFAYPDQWRQDLLKVLLELFDHDKDQRIAEGLSVAALSAKSNFSSARLTNVLEELSNQNVRVLEKMVVDGEIHFRLPHERLIPAIRQLSGSILAENDRARLVLDTGYRTWIRSHSSNYFLSDSDIQFVRKHQLVKHQDLPAELAAYYKLSLRHRRVRWITSYAAMISGLAFVLFFSLKSDWQVTQVATMSPNGEFRTFSMQPIIDGNMIVTGMASNSEVRIWDVHTADVMQKIAGDAFLLSPNKRYLLVRENQGKSIDMLDLNSKIRRRTPFDYHMNFNDIQFGDTGETVFYMRRSSDNTSSYDSRDSHDQAQVPAFPPNQMLIWSFNSGHSSTLAVDKPLLAPGKSVLQEHESRFVGTAQSDYLPKPAAWDVKDQHFLGFLNHYGHITSSFAVFGNVAFVLEKYDDTKTAAELWNLETATLIRETLIASRFKSLSFTTAEFGRNGKIVYVSGLPKKNDQPNDKSPLRIETVIFDVENLAEMANIGIENNPTKMAEDFLFWSSGPNSARIFDTSKNFTTVLPGIAFEDIKHLVASPDSKNVVLLTRKGDVMLCQVDLTNSTCHTISHNASALFQIQGVNRFGVLTNVGTLSAFSYDGKERQFLPTTGTFGDKFLVSANPDDNEIFAWTEDGQVLRYKRQWTLFGWEI